MRTPPPGGSVLTFQFSCQSVKLGIQCPHLGTFLFSGHWNIGDVYIHASGLVPGWSGFSFASLSESNMLGLAKPRPAKPTPTTPRRTILCCVFRNLGVPRLTEANAESISHRCVGAGRSERLFGLYLGHWPLLGALRFFSALRPHHAPSLCAST